MKDKFCVSKTLVYLVVLAAAVVGTFFLTNYTNNQKLTSNSEAAGGKCYWASVKNYPNGCGTVTQAGSLAQSYNLPFTEDTSRSTATSKCCVAQKQPATTGQTCRQKGGTDWYRDTSSSALKTRLSQGLGGNSVTVTSVTGPFSDQQTGKYCYKVTYGYAAQGDQTCKQKGGSAYFRESTAGALKTRLEQGLSGYTVTVTGVTGPFSDQQTSRYCYRVSYNEKADTTCSGQGGVWWGYSSCAAAEAAWDPNGTSSDVISNPSFSYTDTRAGSVCCVRK